MYLWQIIRKQLLLCFLVLHFFRRELEILEILFILFRFDFFFFFSLSWIWVELWRKLVRSFWNETNPWDNLILELKSWFQDQFDIITQIHLILYLEEYKYSSVVLPNSSKDTVYQKSASSRTLPLQLCKFFRIPGKPLVRFGIQSL